jgi:RNase P subunit RPR2
MPIRPIAACPPANPTALRFLEELVGKRCPIDPASERGVCVACRQTVMVPPRLQARVAKGELEVHCFTCAAAKHKAGARIRTMDEYDRLKGA